MNPPVLSIVILTWNAREMVLDCLGSIHEEAGDLSLEVVLVVNGSRDGTAEAVRERFPWVRLIENERNVGFTRGSNLGIRESRGAYVLLLNDDTRVLPGSLQEMIRYVEAHPDVGAVGPQLVGPDGGKQSSVHGIPSLLSELVPVALLEWILPRAFPGKRRSYPGPVTVPAVLGACMLVRREALDRVGLLDEGFFAFLEETDWHLRAHTQGYRTVFLPDVNVVHIQGASSKKRFPGPTRVEYYRSLYRFHRKHYGPLVFGAILAFRWVKLLLNVLWLFLLDRAIGRWKEKVGVRYRSFLYLLRWHLRGRPAAMGLAGGSGGEGGTTTG